VKPKPIVFGLALAALYFAILMPPEAFSEGKVAVLLCASFAFFIAVTERWVDQRYLAGGLIVFGVLTAHGLLLSVDVYRSVEFVTILWIYYALIGFFLYYGQDPVKPLAVSMVTLSLIVSFYGLYQYFWGFEELSKLILHSGSDQIVTEPLLKRVATHRVFSTLALPGTLWGFLVMAIPFHFELRNKAKRFHWLNVVLAISGAALLATGFLTRSFGFLVGLLTLTLVWLFRHHRRMLWNKLSVVLLLLGAVGASFYSARIGVIEGSNPVVLRFANWISAWSIFYMHPLGTGLNTFGIMYPRYMLTGANETQYTHNSILQLTSELGYIAIAGAAIAILFAVKRWSTEVQVRIAQRECVLLALAVWCIHNLIDIDIYFASVGSVGAILIGTLLRTPKNSETTLEVQPLRRPGNVLVGVIGLFSLIIVAFSGFVQVSTELQQRSQMEHDTMKPRDAEASLQKARALMPLDSSLFHDSGEIELELSQKLHEPKFLAAAQESFTRAIQLSPNKVGPHVGLALCLSSQRELDGALREIRIAQNLYPDSSYVQAVARLLEKNAAAHP
jgi:hypothetical protein